MIMTFSEWVRLPGFTSRRNQPSFCVASSWSSCQGRWEQAWIPSHGSAFNSYLQFSCGNGHMKVKAWVQTSDVRRPDLRKLPATSWLSCIFERRLPISHLCNFHVILDADPPLPQVCFFKVQSTPLKYSYYSSSFWNFRKITSFNFHLN